jgi:hypothetical protein
MSAVGHELRLAALEQRLSGARGPRDYAYISINRIFQYHESKAGFSITLV